MFSLANLCLTITCYDRSVPALHQSAIDIEQRFTQIVTSSPSDYVRSVSLRYQQELKHGHRDLRLIEDAIDTVGTIRDDLQTCCDNVWQEFGCSSEWHRLNTVVKSARRVVGDLQELLCDVL